MFYLQGALKRREKEHGKSCHDNTFFQLLKDCTTALLNKLPFKVKDLNNNPFDIFQGRCLC